MNHSPAKYLVIVGPTASGKSTLALELAQHFGAHIVSCDSVQLYRDFNIGSAKPTQKERAQISHHLIDIIDWHTEYDASCYAQDARAVLNQLDSAAKRAIIVGGSGLYLRALWGENWDNLPSDKQLRAELSAYSNEELQVKLQKLVPERAQKIHLNDRYRLLRGVEIALLNQRSTTIAVPLSNLDVRSEFLVVLIMPDRGVLLQRITARTAKMVKDGLIEEVQGLIAQGCPLTAKPMQSIGYKQVIDMLAKKTSTHDLIAAIDVATRQYAKRQKTWFQKINRDLQVEGVRLTPDQLNFIKTSLGW